MGRLQLSWGVDSDASFTLALTSVLPRIKRGGIERVYVETEWTELLAHNPGCEAVKPGFAPPPGTFIVRLPRPDLFYGTELSPAYSWAAVVAKQLADARLLDLSSPIPAVPKVYVTAREAGENLLDRGVMKGKRYWIVAAPAEQTDLRRVDVHAFRAIVTALTYAADFPCVVQAGGALDTAFHLFLRSGAVSLLNRVMARETVVVASKAEGALCRPGVYELLAAAFGKPRVLVTGQWAHDPAYLAPDTIPGEFVWDRDLTVPILPRKWICPQAGCGFRQLQECPHGRKCVNDPYLHAVIADATKDAQRREDAGEPETDDQNVSRACVRGDEGRGRRAP